jgi:hypothetical protein
MGKITIRKSISKYPQVQHALAFVAGLAGFFIAATIAGWLPVYEFLPLPHTIPVGGPNLAWYNFWTNLVATLVPAVISGLGFWAFAAGLKALGVKILKTGVIWLGAVTAASLLLIVVVAQVMLGFTYYSALNADNQIYFDIVFLILLGLSYNVGWWVVRRTGLKR